MSTKTGKSQRNAFMAVGMSLLVGAAAAPATAAQLDLAPLPLFLGGLVDPNVMFTMDDSGSMSWSYMPDARRSFTVKINNNDTTVYGHTLNRGLAANWNWMAFDPNLDYPLPVGPDGKALPEPNYQAAKGNKAASLIAWDDGYKHYAYIQNPRWTTTDSCEIDLVSSYRPTWHYGDQCNSTDENVEGWPEYHALGATKEPPYYYQYDGSGDVEDEANYVRVNVDTADPVMMKKFGRWYSYYRKRTLLAKAGISRAFFDLPSGMRVGFGRINKLENAPEPLQVDGYDNSTITLGVRPFDKAGRDAFFKKVFLAPSSESTPLRRAADDVGLYFERQDDKGPWGKKPGDGGQGLLSCRQSYHIIMSDGYWNSEGASTVAATDNNDGTDGAEIIGPDSKTYTYEAGTPFSDSWDNSNVTGGTLADVAMHYWKRDLQPQDGMPNDVPPNGRDPAFWQHLVTFAIGLGLDTTQTGHVNADTAFAAVTAFDLYREWEEGGMDGTAPPKPVTITWPQPGTNSEYNIDDMLHAAVNSRGGFYSARNPDEFANAIRGALEGVVDRAGSAASVVLNSGALSDESRVYQAKFDTGSNSGQLLAFDILQGVDEGKVAKDESWDAATKLPVPSTRTIATFNDESRVGVSFNTTDGLLSSTALSTAQKALLEPNADLDGNGVPDLVLDTNGDGSADAPLFPPDSDALLQYVRGGIDNEQSKGGPFRNRFRRGNAQSPLGDIIHSAPAYVGAPNSPFPDAWGDGQPESQAANKYSDFRFRWTFGLVSGGIVVPNTARKPMIYVGANDGLLHAFDASLGSTEGAEQFAYLPAAAFANLKAFSDPLYGHINFVDGSPTVGDAFFRNSDSGTTGIWRTVLVSGLRGGGKSVFALDITEPTANTAAAGNTPVNWVLWEFTHPELGYTYSRPNIVRLYNGKWAAVFGNGYNSTSGKAGLFIVDIRNGALIQYIDTGAGGVDAPNGLATVAPVDIDGDFKVDYVYGGDLLGNLWKFDLTGATGEVAFKSGNTPAPLFVAKGPTGLTQPITTRPQVTRKPYGEPTELIVMFGTGKYLEKSDSDLTSPATQSFYGILDDGTNGAARTTSGDLLQQTILAESTALGSEYRIVSSNELTWRSLSKKTTGYRGWYLDLVDPDDGKNHGERQVSDSVLRNNRVIFTTVLPAEDPCQFGGSSWLMELDARTGGAPPYPVFDVDGDGAFELGLVGGSTQGDALAVNGKEYSPAGVKSQAGILPTPAILAREGGGKEFKYFSTSKGQVEVVSENPGAEDFGRQSWIQLIK
jgi:type IV pilus assembly protein PilY1